MIEDSRARSLAAELKRCSYYETCANYGLNVDRVFHDACQKVANLRSHMLVTMSNIVNATSTAAAAACSSASNAQQQQSSLRLLSGSHMTTANPNPSLTNGAITTTTTTSSSSTASSNAAPTCCSSSSVGGHMVSSNLSNAVVSATIGLNGSSSAANPSTSPLSQSGASSAQNTPQAQFYQANPHLLNSAALHSANNTQPAASASVFKEPFCISDKAAAFKPLAAAKDSHTSNLLQVPENAAVNHKLDSLVTPISTPSQKRKDNNRRRSNLFTVSLFTQIMKSNLSLNRNSGS